MAEFDYLTLLPTIIAIVVSFVMVGVTKLGKTSDSALTGKVKIGQIEINLERLEKEIAEVKEDAKDSLAKICTRLEKIETEVRIHRYRIGRIDKGVNGDYYNHGSDETL